MVIVGKALAGGFYPVSAVSIPKAFPSSKRRTWRSSSRSKNVGNLRGRESDHTVVEVMARRPDSDGGYCRPATLKLWKSRPAAPSKRTVFMMTSPR